MRLDHDWLLGLLVAQHIELIRCLQDRDVWACGLESQLIPRGAMPAVP